MKKILIGLALTALIMPIFVFAATEHVNEEGVMIGPEETLEGNQYMASSNITVYGTVTGDLNAAAGMVNLFGNVQGNVLVAGGMMNIGGVVDGDLRAVGGQLILSGEVHGDVLMAGGNIIMQPGTVIDGDLYAAGGSVIMTGVANTGVNVAGGAVLLGGVVNGDVSLTSEELQIMESSTINGDFWYRSMQAVDLPDGVVSGMTTFAPYPEAVKPVVNRAGHLAKGEAKTAAGVFGAMFVLFKIIILLIAVLVLVLAFPKNTTKIVKQSYKGFWMNLLVGLAFIFATPIIAGILLFTMLGAYVGILILAIWLFALLLSAPLAHIHFGSLLFKWAKKEKVYAVTVGSAVVGSLVLQSLALFPFFGILLCLVFTALALGSEIRYFYESVMKVEKA